MSFFRRKEVVYLLGVVAAIVIEDDPNENTVLVKEKGNLSPPRYMLRDLITRVYNKRFMEQYEVCPFCNGEGEYYEDEKTKEGQIVGIGTVGPIPCRCKKQDHDSTR